MEPNAPLDRDIEYRHLLKQIVETFTAGQLQSIRAVNVHLVSTYWAVGRHIVEYEQAGQAKAKYGTRLMRALADDLRSTHGKGFSRSNLVYMRLLYLRYPTAQLAREARQ